MEIREPQFHMFTINFQSVSKILGLINVELQHY